MGKFRAVLFDLDGTLIDSVRLILDSYHHTLATHELPARTDEHWLQGMGTPLRVQFKDWAHDPARLEAMILTYREYNLLHHDNRIAPYPGVIEMMTTIRAHGLGTGLVTSKNREGALRGLRVSGLEGTMEVIVGADDVTHPKPHPEPVLRALEQLDASPRETLFVGDSVHDMESGRQAGVSTAAALWGPFTREHLTGSQPDHWLERPSDLMALFGD